MMRRVFFVILGFYFLMTTVGILFMGIRLFAAKERVESLTEAQKSLIKRLELRDIVYQLKDAAIDPDRSKAEIIALKSKVQTVVSECHSCHHSHAIAVRIAETGDGIDQFIKKLDRNSYHNHEEILIAAKQAVPFAEDAYEKAKSLSDTRLREVKQELYSVEGIGIIISFAGLFLFAGFSAVFLRRISRLESEAEEKERRLIQSEKLSAMGQMVAGVAHELNNPLTAVVGYSELLSSAANDADIRQMAETIKKSAVRIANVVNDLLAFSWAPRLERTSVNIKGMIAEALCFVSEALTASKINFSLDVADGLTASLDKTQMERVLLNLIANAIHAIRDSKRGDKIVLNAYKQKNTVIIEISDNGPGIPHQIINKIFEPFFTTKGFGKGTGLGLSICYNIIKAHDGDIRVKSMEGEGTTFIIELPC